MLGSRESLVDPVGFWNQKIHDRGPLDPTTLRQCHMEVPLVGSCGEEAYESAIRAIPDQLEVAVSVNWGSSFWGLYSKSLTTLGSFRSGGVSGYL